MKRNFLLSIMALFASVILLATGHADDSTMTEEVYTIGTSMVVHELVWTADAATGAFTSTNTKNIDGYVFCVESDPAPYTIGYYFGTTYTATAGSDAAYSPTALYDITLTDTSGLDVMNGTMADRSQTATESVQPKFGGIPVYGPLTVNISNNSVVSASGIIRIFIFPF